jgi:hypothetical protein
VSEIKIEIRKVPIFITAVLILLVGLASAAGTGSGPVISTTVQTINGLVFKITGAFTVTLAAFQPLSGGPASAQPYPWFGGECTAATTAGDWGLFVNLQLNTLPTALTTYTITVFGNQGFGLNSLTFSVPTTATVGTATAFQFDLNTSTLPGTSTILITVQ